MADVGITPQPPEADGAAQLRRLQAGGFSQQELDGYKADKTAKLTAGGFTPQEVSNYWGEAAPDPAKANAMGAEGINALTPDQQAHVATNPWEAFQAGWQNSDLGLLTGGKPTTVAPENQGLFNSIMQATGGFIGDAPATIAGWQIGALGGAGAGAMVPGGGETGATEAAGAVVGGGAMSAALPQAIREGMLDYYNGGQVKDFKTFFSMVSASVIRTMKAAVVGGVAAPLGGAAGGKALAATGSKIVGATTDAVTMATAATATGAALDGQVPKPQDFIAGAVIALGIHAGSTVGGKFVLSDAGARAQTNLQRIYAERGIKPQDAVAAAARDPVIRQEILGQDPHGEAVTPTLKTVSPAEPTPYHKPPEPEPAAAAASSPTKPQFNVARKGADGTVTIGKPGQIHIDLMSDKEQDGETPFDPREMGFADKDGNFLTRAQAAAARGEKGRAESVRMNEPGAAAATFGKAPLASESGGGAHIAPDVDHLLPLMRKLEGSGDAAVSPAGAIGRYQLMPGTARQYGFDVSKLTDPEYNEQAARAVLKDLYHRYNGNVDDILVAYNAGPGRANRWIAGGRRIETLPTETQKYLEHSDRINGWTRGEGGDNGAGTPPGGGGGKPPAVPGAEGGAAEPDPFKLSKDTLEDTMHDIVGEPRPPESAFNPDRMYRQWVSELGPARNIDKLFKAEGMIKPGDNAMNTEDMFRQTYGSDQRAGFFVRFGTLSPSAVDEQGRGFIDKTSDESFLKAYGIAKDAGGDARGFDAYRIAKRTVEKNEQGIKTGVDVAKAQALVDKTEKVYGPASQMINRVKNASLDYAQESGIFSKTQADRIKDLNQHHLTFARLVGEDEVPLQGRGRGFKAYNPLKKMNGGEDKIMDPLTADIDNLHRIVSMADRNRAIGHVIGAIEAHENLGETLGIRKLTGPAAPTLAEPGSNVFKPYNLDPKAQEALEPFIAAKSFKGSKSNNQFLYFRDGKAEVWEAADPDLAQLFRGADAKPEMDFFTKTATFFAKTSRSGITLSPDYASRITARHQLTAAIFDRNGGIPFSDVMSGAVHAFKLDDVYQKWVANGGAGTALVDMDVNYIKRDVNTIMESTNTWNRMWNVARHPVQFSQLISERMDAAARTGYMARNEENLGPLKAATGGRKAYLDYVERGTSSIAQWMAQTTPFMRPHITGVKQAYEAFTERPLQTMAKTALYVSLPTAGLYYLNYLQDKYGGLPEDQKYENLPRWQKDTLFIAPQVFGVRLRLMTPPIVGPIFGGMMNRFLDHFVKSDPHAFEDWGKSVLAEFLPPVIPQIAMPIVEGMANHSFFSGHSLIPASMEDNTGPMQYTENTSAPAKALSRVLGPNQLNLANVSPIVIDNYVKQWGGTLGGNVLKAMNLPFHEGDAPWTVADVPFVQSFVIRNPGMGAEPIQNFYDGFQKTVAAKADLKEALAHAMGGDPSELRATVSNPEAYENMMDVAHALKVQHQAIIGITHNDKMSDDEKRQFIDKTYSAMIITAKAGLKAMDAINGSH